MHFPGALCAPKGCTLVGTYKGSDREGLVLHGSAERPVSDSRIPGIPTTPDLFGKNMCPVPLRATGYKTSTVKTCIAGVPGGRKCDSKRSEPGCRAKLGPGPTDC